jgi:hypothetical protein
LLFPLAVALAKVEVQKNSDIEQFKYLWESHQYLWSFGHVLRALNMVLSFADTDANSSDIDLIDDSLVFLMRSRTTHGLFLSLTHQQRLTQLQQILENFHDNQFSGNSFMLVSELCLWPYHTTSMVLFLSASHTNYHHFFIRALSMLLPRDVDEFIKCNEPLSVHIVQEFGGS